jgi:hypothetical protein
MLFYSCHKLEVGVVRDDHKLNITWSAQNNMVGPEEVDHLKSEHFSMVVAYVSECDRQSNMYEWDGLHARDHSIKWVWTAFEMVPGQP